MQRQPITRTVYKLAIAGEQAGFSLEDMIQLLNAGITVETLLHLIELRLGADGEGANPSARRSSRWIM
jgi:hypothetical protein